MTVLLSEGAKEKDSHSERRSRVMPKERSLMLKLTLRYMHYVLSALATIGFSMEAQ
jgi:hypothetical protein